jgi:metallo-beta-lactamase family protein
VSIIAKKDNNVTINVIGGNAEGVTGSCSVINYNGKTVLFELGGIQEGHNEKENYNYNKSLISDIKDKENIGFVILGHSHSDHVANVPALYCTRNCKAKIIVPKGNKAILKEMWLDSAFINARVSETIKFKTKKDCVPLYTENEVYTALDNVIEYPFGEIVQLDDSLSIRFIHAGHILFSAQTEMFFKMRNSVKKVTFTSDLGNVNLKDSKVFISPFEPITKSNVVIGECTYAARNRSVTKKDIEKDIQDMKDAVLNYCVKNGRTLFIPCFALDRTPYILWLLYYAFSDDMTFFTRIIIDSPLAIRLLDVYSKELEGEAKRMFDEMLDWRCIELSKTAIESAEAMVDGEPKVVLSSSGMLEAGRGVRWAKRILPNKQDCIMFIGYATPNTNAYKIKNGTGQGTFIIGGDTVNNKCNIKDLHGFSSHMQREDLINYYSNINCQTVYLVHGNKNDKEEFALDLQKEISRKNRTGKVVSVDYKTKIIV